MKTTEKRITLNLTKEDVRILNLLISSTGEHAASVIKKALLFYHIYYFDKQKDL